jgi:hypothetical protein
MGGPPVPPPGGTKFCTRYDKIVKIPDPTKCFANPFYVFDPDGTHLSQSVDATVTASTVDVLLGFIGNVAQSNIEVDKLRVFESDARVTLEQSHTAHTPLPHQLGPKLGPLKGGLGRMVATHGHRITRQKTSSRHPMRNWYHQRNPRTSVASSPVSQALGRAHVMAEQNSHSPKFIKVPPMT